MSPRTTRAKKRAKHPEPSCFVLELSVDPGGSRRGDVFVYARAEHLRVILEQELLGEPANVVMAAYLAIAYGERMLVWVVQGGTITDGIDLHPFIRANWRDEERFVALDDRGGMAKLIAAYGGAFGDDLGVRFAIDWDGLEGRLPALEGVALLPSGTVRLSDPEKRLRKARSFLTTSCPVPYGYSDLEGGAEAPAEWEDPDPPGCREAVPESPPLAATRKR